MADSPSISSLRQQGYRFTPQRLVILRTLEEAERHLTPVEIFQRAQRQLPGLTETTVYRTLNFLTGQGLILAAHIGSGQLVYENAERDHHHIICRDCGHSEEVDHKEIEPLYRRLHADTGYQIDSLHLTFFGTCPHCLEVNP